MSEFRPAVEQLCAKAFGAAVTVGMLEDANKGRGAFSVVVRAQLSWPEPLGMPDRVPKSVIAKLPVSGPNGTAAVTSGAYRRELLAYRELLTDGPVPFPLAYATEESADGGCSLLLQDLSDHRSVDQLDGLGRQDAITVALTLAELHSHWRGDSRLDQVAVRRTTIATLPPDRLQAGLTCLDTTWDNELSLGQRRIFAELVDGADQLTQRFEQAEPTLCHGDPRADNLVFGEDDRVSGQDRAVLFDWQQMAVQFGETDLAWLTATSLETKTRRATEAEVVEAYGGDFERYRLGMALPGMAVLLLAQRELSSARTKQLVATSLQRIAAALEDLEVNRIVPSG